MEDQNKPRDVYILLLGESGAGKSTFINSLANYLEYHSLEEAMASEIMYNVPARFTVTDENYDEIPISIGNPDTENYSGHIVTKGVTDYEFSLKGNIIMHLIDTPPLGVEDDENMDQILSYISKCSYLNAVVFFLKPNVSILSQYFKHCLNSLLTPLNTPVFNNIVFVFTHTRSTFYKPGETLTILQNVLKDMSLEAKVTIPCSKANMFCLDNEIFRYLVAHKDGVKSDVSNMKVFSQSWKLSSQCCHSFMRYIIGNSDCRGLQPFMIQIPICNKTLLEATIKLVETLADISLVLHENLQILHSEEIMSSKKDVPLISLVKVTPTAIGCIDCVIKKKILTRGNAERAVFKCIQNEEDFDIKRNSCRRFCTDCRCELRHHQEIFYLQQMKCEPISKGEDRQMEITTLISLLEYQMEAVLQFLAECQIFRKLNSSPKSDFYKDFLKSQSNKRYTKKEEYADIKKKYHKKLIEAGKQKFTSNDIATKLQTLYELKYTGQMLRSICNDLLPKNEVFKKQSIKVCTAESPTMKERKSYECFRNKGENSEKQTYDGTQNLEPKEQPKLQKGNMAKGSEQRSNLLDEKKKAQDEMPKIHNSTTDNYQTREVNLKIVQLKEEFLQYKVPNSTSTNMPNSYSAQEKPCSSRVNAGVHNEGYKKETELDSENKRTVIGSASGKVGNQKTSLNSTSSHKIRTSYVNKSCKSVVETDVKDDNVNTALKFNNKSSGTTKSISNVSGLNQVPEKVKKQDNIRKTSFTDSTNSLDEQVESYGAGTNLKVEDAGRNFNKQERKGENTMTSDKKYIDVMTKDRFQSDDQQGREENLESINLPASYLINVIHRQYETIQLLSKKVDSLETLLNNNTTSQIELSNKLDKASHIPAQVEANQIRLEDHEARILNLETILQHFTTHRY